jgi:Ran GTPase-activating protein (RanGAP) involved in mRNA processing and transport
MDEWVLYGDSTVRFLAETLVTSRVQLDLSDCGLGHVAYRALLAVLDALAAPRATVALKSLYHYPPSNRVQVVNLSGNRLDDAVGDALAAVLGINRVMTHLDLSDNLLGDRAGVAISRALGQNRYIRVLVLGGNVLGAEAGQELAKTLRRNRSITRLDLSSNRLGPRTFWKGPVRNQVRGAGEALASALVSNKSVTALNLANNALGEEFGG